MTIIEQHIDSIKQLCKEHKVEFLYAFGSALTKDFHQDSDIDFVVKFQKIPTSSYFENYWEFKDSLENIFNRKVDLVEDQAIKNTILRKSIDKSKKLVYGRLDSKVAA